MTNNFNQLGFDDRFSVSVLMHGQIRLTAVPTAVDPRHVTVQGSVQQPGNVPIGAMVTMKFSGGPLRKSLTVGAIANARRDGVETVNYEFIFNDLREIVEHLVSVFDSYFNRRAAFRVRPDSKLHLTAKLESRYAKLRVLAAVQDVSATGCSVHVSQQVEEAYADLEELRIKILLPHMRDMMSVNGIIRHRRLEGGQVRYGIEFIAQASSQFRRQQEQIVEYVMRQQRDYLKRRRDYTPLEPMDIIASDDAEPDTVESSNEAEGSTGSTDRSEGACDTAGRFDNSVEQVPTDYDGGRDG